MNEENVGVEPVAKGKHFLSPAQRAEWVRRFTESGVTVPQFCEDHGLVPVTLYRWLAKSEQAKGTVGVAAPAAPMPAFAEIKLSASNGSSPWAAELCRPNGVVLRVGRDLPAELLEQLLRLC